MNEILKKGYVCNHCLGRQSGLLLSGYSNKERGEWIRNLAASEYELSKKKVDESNFYGYKFRIRKVQSKKPGQCFVCQDLFKNLNKIANKIIRKLNHKQENNRSSIILKTYPQQH